MFVIKKNQVVITALVVMIAAAGYLNYIDSAPSDVSEVMLSDSQEEEEGIVAEGETTADTTSKEAEIEEDDNNYISGDATDGTDVGSAVFVNNSDDSSYFVQAKLEREQSRAKQKDILNDMLNNEKLDTNGKSEVTTAMLAIQQRIEKETAAEAMLEAKGFKEAYVRIDDDTVDVVVDKAELTNAEVAQIEDIIKRKTGVSTDKIRISPLK
jgi:stage III sporulation protein AH